MCIKVKRVEVIFRIMRFTYNSKSLFLTLLLLYNTEQVNCQLSLAVVIKRI